MVDKEKAADWTEEQKEKANTIANDFLEGKVQSIPQE